MAFDSQEEIMKNEAESSNLKKVDSRTAELNTLETKSSDPRKWLSIVE